MTSPFSKDFAPKLTANQVKSGKKILTKVDPHINSQVILAQKETSQQRADRRKKLERSNSFV